MNVCPLGHTLTGGKCYACDKRAKANLRKPREPELCALHTDETAPCPRCAKANAENAAELAATEPWHERWRHFVPHAPTPEMVTESRRMFAPHVTLEPIKTEDHR